MYINRKICVWLVALLVCFSNAQAQGDASSYIAWYKSFSDHKKNAGADLLLAEAQKKLNSAGEANDASGEVRALQELALLHISQSHDYEKAIDYLIHALAIGDSSHLEIPQIFTFLAIASVFHDVGNYYKSADFLEQALALNKTAGDPDLYVLILSELGKTYLAMGKMDEASGFYEQILANKEGLPAGAEAEALFNLAQVFQQKQENEKALDYYKRSLSLDRVAHNKNDEATCLNKIGEVYGAMKNDEKELANYTAAFAIRQNIKDKSGIAESGNAIGGLYFQQKNYARASANLTIAMRAGQEAQDQEQLKRTYELLSQCFSATGQFKEAVGYKDLFIAVNDFMDHDKNEQRLLEAQSRYVLEKKQLEIKKLQVDNIRREKELSDQKMIQTGLLGLIGLSVIIVGLIFYLYLNKRRSNSLLTAAHKQLNHQNNKLKELNATKDKFFSILGHDLKGPLNSLSSFSNLLSNHLESLTQDEIKMLSKDLDKQLKNLFALLENLLEWSRSQTGAIDFTPETFDLAAVLEENKELLRGQSQNKKITMLGPEGNSVTVLAHKPSIHTVVRNLISNAIKFTPEGGAIKLEIISAGEFATVSIADTGVGMSSEVISKLFRIDTKHSTKGTANEKGTGLGLILCKDFVEKNHGKLSVESEEGQGSVFYFSVPLQKM